MHLCYFAVSLVIASYHITYVVARHSDDNIINVELDVPNIINNILKFKGLKISHNLEGGNMRADSDDYVLKIKFPNLGSIARMFLVDRRYNTHPKVEVGPGAFKTEMVKYPTDKMQKDLNKLLAIKNILDKKNNVNSD